MANPDTLRPEVREAMNRIIADAQYPEDFECVQAELLRMTQENADLRSSIELNEQVWIQRNKTMHKWIKRARKAESELAALKAREWQPIGTAPRDGTPVDLWHKAGFRQTETWWDADDECWSSANDDSDFTHWMPLPPPPKGED